MRRLNRAFLVIGAAAALGGGLAACGGDDDSSDADATTEEAPAATAQAEPATTEQAPAPTTTEAPEPEPPPMAAPGLPQDVAGFMSWLRLNAEPIPPDPAAPHGETKNVFVNQTRADLTQGGSQQFPYPNGTIVVKEGSRGGDRAAIVAIMRKMAGVDPAHGDWEYIEYARNSPDEAYTVLAQDEVCWTCHAAAEGTDWVYTALE